MAEDGLVITGGSWVAGTRVGNPGVLVAGWRGVGGTRLAGRLVAVEETAKGVAGRTAGWGVIVTMPFMGRGTHSHRTRVIVKIQHFQDIFMAFSSVHLSTTIIFQIHKPGSYPGFDLH